MLFIEHSRSGGDWLKWHSQLEFDNLESKRLELAVRAEGGYRHPL